MSMHQKKPRIELIIEVAVHVLTWSYIFLSPLFFKRRDETINWDHYLHGCILPVVTCVSFYLNYFLLIPQFLLYKHKLRWFFIFNVCLFFIYQLIVELQGMISPLPMPAKEAGVDFQHFPPRYLFVIRGFLFYVFAVGASVAIKLSMSWKKSEQARAEAELGRSQAELKNLKNQINPHFLLNTLNNIYALTAFDQEKAQQAIHELSRLLRYMLYENQTECVSLSKEADFLRSYVELMRLRLYDEVDVQVNFDFPSDENIPIAPLIFISLVENAFKHGVSANAKSFIHISLTADSHHLHFCCENSNTPKNETDKAPGGIGLKQVASRLEYSYPKCYRWVSGISSDGKTYRSVIDIYDKPIE